VERVEARPGASQRGLTVPMTPPPPGSPDPFSPFSSGVSQSPAALSAADLSRDFTISGRTERMPYIPPDEELEERTPTPTVVVVVLVVLALGVALALASVVM
jgi:hypothetical protein